MQVDVHTCLETLKRWPVVTARRATCAGVVHAVTSVLFCLLCVFSPSHSHPSLSAYTRARGMDHSAPITLNANQGRRRATKRCPPMRAVAKPSKSKLAPRSQKWPLGHRQGTMLRCATATVPTASHTSQAPISTTQDANSASAALHASPCAALRPRSSLSTYIFTIHMPLSSRGKARWRFLRTVVG